MSITKQSAAEAYDAWRRLEARSHLGMTVIWRRSDPDEQQVGQRIKLYGKTIQKQAQQSLQKAQQYVDF
ncbi:MAG: hypothetical protein NHB32_17045 [Fischerella sp. CENA71]|nr:hypothetical protein [Fischerella sp. CENA71]